MALQQLKREHGFTVGLFRRSGDINYFGSAEQLFQEVFDYNSIHEGDSCVVIHSMFEQENADGTKKGIARINIGVYGNNLGECKAVLNTFAKPPKAKQAKST